MLPSSELSLFFRYFFFFCLIYCQHTGGVINYLSQGYSLSATCTQIAVRFRECVLSRTLITSPVSLLKFYTVTKLKTDLIILR